MLLTKLKMLEKSQPKVCLGNMEYSRTGRFLHSYCDNKLFIKPTESGRSSIKDVVEAPPYPGAKPCFLIEDKLDDRDRISNLVRITVKELPEPKPKKRKSKKKNDRIKATNKCIKTTAGTWVN